jgi:4-aminobutyrate--pyruvate transaminase
MFVTETYYLKPDMISLAKALSSGYQPISALMVSEDIFNLIAKESQKIGIFGHGYTYGGHPVPCAVALEAMKIYKQMDLIGHVGKIAPKLPPEHIICMNMCGRGDKDIFTVAKALNFDMEFS